MKKLILLIQVAILFLAVTKTYSQPGWFWQNPYPTGFTLESVIFINQNTGWAVGWRGTIFRTINGGTNWTQQSSGSSRYLKGVSFTDANNGTAVGDTGTILRTTNGGTNWISQISGTTKDLYGVSFTDANTGTVVGDYSTILRTTNGGGVFINQRSSEIPEGFSLYQNYPNPFNPVTTIRFDLHNSSYSKLIIYNILGKEIATLVNEKLSVGSYEVNWNASEYPSGVYFYKLITEEFTNTRKMILLK
ncbi:YCF48-related protein [Bacteroidota bacterium]